jgi:hypothetical protein
MVDDPVKKSRQTKTPIDSAIQSHIGHQLRAMYDETASEPVPDDLLRLLDRLGGADKNKDGGSSSSTAGPKASESA